MKRTQPLAHQPGTQRNLGPTTYPVVPRYGYAYKIDSLVSPAASSPSSRETGKRNPRMAGFPPQIYD